MCDRSEIADFFKGQSVFITGGTGFLGKLLVEKLLRDCRDLEKIYLLIRPKKQKSTEQRLEELFSYACFDRLKSENRQSLKKVFVISGDCEKPNLGISDSDLSLLENEVTGIFHVAANVKFDLPLRLAFRDNIKPTIAVLKLAKKVKNLKSMVYVSTAYSNCTRENIEEKIYNPPMTAQNLEEMLEILDEDTVNCLTPKLLDKWPNTYCYSKSIAESMVQCYGKDLPIAIVRPAIVLSTIKEPMVGWIDNFYGPVGISVAAGIGVLPSMYGKRDCSTYVVPVDYTANMILASSWKIGLENNSNDNIKIYNYIGSHKTKITWGYYRDTFMGIIPIYPLSRMLWYPTFTIRTNKFLHNFYTYFLKVICYVVDFLLVCCMEKPLAVQNFTRLITASDMTTHFVLRNLRFEIGNVEDLWKRMNDKDRETFTFNMDDIDWYKYFLGCSIGARVYLLKDGLENLPAARRKHSALKYLHFSVLAIFYYLVFKFVLFLIYKLLLF